VLRIWSRQPLDWHRELSDGGKCTTTAAMIEANQAPDPAHTTRPSRRTRKLRSICREDVRKWEEQHAGQKVIVPNSGTWMEVSLAGPIKLEQQQDAT